jgi:RNA recognition motif-containing protein
VGYQKRLTKQFYTNTSLLLVRSVSFVNSLCDRTTTIGDIIEVQLPSAAINPNQQPSDVKHRGFGFVTYASPADAQDAIDNMDLNELQGKVIKVNLARPMKGPIQPQGNRAGKYTPSIPR